MAHEFDGTRYAAAATHQREWGAKLIAELGLKGHERVLDLGCGDGALTVEIAKQLPRGEVVGIDASEGMIRAAVPKARGNVRFLQMDVDRPAFEGRFDVVFSNAALHWVKDHRRLLANVRELLSSHGVVRSQFAGAGNCRHFFKVVREAMAAGPFAASLEAFEWPWYTPTVEEYRALVASAGFAESRVWGENADRHFPDEAAMIRWIDQPSIVPFLAHLPEAQRAAFRDFVVGRMIEETRQEDGTCFETFRRINLRARA